MKTTEASRIIMDAGFVNNRDVCIESMGSTFACVCDTCSEARHKMIAHINANVDLYIKREQQRRDQYNALPWYRKLIYSLTK